MRGGREYRGWSSFPRKIFAAILVSRLPGNVAGRKSRAVKSQHESRAGPGGGGGGR